jgi:predicted permease
MNEEFRLHLELRAEDLARSGFSPAEAARRAQLEFGHAESYKQESRVARGLGPFDELRVSWLDVKLGFRMLIKYPGLTLVGGLGIAVAVAIGTGVFAMSSAIYATVPLDEGERVVAIENWDMQWNNQEWRILHDFVSWRDELTSVQDLGAFRDFDRNLIVEGSHGEPIRVAEMTPSGFRLARVRPLLGRTLVEEDERERAPPVIVIGYDVWHTRFAGDPQVVGSSVRLGSAVHTVVGVMPEGFAFPMYHSVWVPLRMDPWDYERRQGPGIRVFGRLAPGVTLEQAGAELTTIARRTALDFPETHARLTPRIMPYAMQLYDYLQGSEIPLLYFFVGMLLVGVCVNVAILVYARTAIRHGEIAVRSALGASRRRIVTQLFVEALVLAAVAAAGGLAVAGVALKHMPPMLGRDSPFWYNLGLSVGTIAYALGLTVVGAAIVGVVPALKATGRRVQASLQHLAVGGSGIRLGKTWTLLIIAQVAVAVAVLPTTVSMGRIYLKYSLADPGFAANEFLTARLLMDRETPPSAAAEVYERQFDSRYRSLQAELVTRLETEPGVSDVLITRGLPGEEYMAWIEVEGLRTPTEHTSPVAVRGGSTGHEVGLGLVDVGFFDTFDVPTLAGRLFEPQDLDSAATEVVVNRAFVSRLLGGGNVLGRRIRYVGRGEDANPKDVELFGRWYEIVGVVGDFPPNLLDPDLAEAKIYHPVVGGAGLILKVDRGAPERFAPRLREIAAALDPGLRLDPILPLDELLREEQVMWRLATSGLALVTLAVIMLSGAGIYALMSVAVTQRRREIGIRSALGAEPRRLLRSIFSRALGQLAIGVVVGVVAAPLLLTVDDRMDVDKVIALLAVSVLMIVVGLVASVGPARRGLRIQPTEALKAD